MIKLTEEYILKMKEIAFNNLFDQTKTPFVSENCLHWVEYKNEKIKLILSLNDYKNMKGWHLSIDSENLTDNFAREIATLIFGNCIEVPKESFPESLRHIRQFCCLYGE